MPPTHCPRRLLSIACVASWLIAASGCCGGRLVSVQLYEGESPSAPKCADCSGAGCKRCHHEPLAGRLKHRHGQLAGMGFGRGHIPFHGPVAGPAAGPAVPLARFHPVPTRPVFEPQPDHPPLPLLPAGPLPLLNDTSPEPTLARPQSVLVR